MDRDRERIELPSAERPRASIVVLLSRADLAEPCLRAIAAAHDPAVACETIVVAGTDDRAVEDLLTERTTGARIVLAAGNAGTVVGWNLAFGIARADRVALLHEDAAPQPGWLAPLLAAVDDGGGRVGAVGSRLLWPDGRLQNRGWVLFRDGQSRQLRDEPPAGDVTPADHVSTAAMVVDRAAWSRVGGWDERFFPALLGQPDFCHALWERGLSVLSHPGSTVVHGTDATTAPGLGPTRAAAIRVFLGQRNAARLREKWGASLDRYAAPADWRFGSEEELAAARAAAWARTLERSAEAAAGRATGDAAPSTDRAITGDDDALVARDERVWVPRPEVAGRLRAAEEALERDYVEWLAAEDGRLRALLDERDARLRRLERELPALRERSETLDRVVAGRWWRLRGAVRRVTGR